jgi:hypothetical protein
VGTQTCQGGDGAGTCRCQPQGFTAGSSCLTLGATVCQGNTVLTCTADALGGCQIWAAPNDCTLCGAIANANAAPGSTVMLPDGMYQLALPGGLTISADVMVTGAGATSTSIDGQQLDRVFTISSGTVTFRDVTVTNGHTRGGFAGGGGIRNSGTLSLTDCVVSNNTSENAEGGGGIINLGTLTVTRTIVSGNQTQGGDGGQCRWSTASSAATRPVRTGAGWRPSAVR